MTRPNSTIREALTAVASARRLDLSYGEFERAARDEHVRHAIYLDALHNAPSEVERDVIAGVLYDPDLAMRESVLASHFDDVALRMGSVEEFEEWADRIGDLFADSPFLWSRLHEWKLLRRVEAGMGISERELMDSSDWLQRRLSDTSVRPAVLRLLAEHGRTKRVRATAQRRLS
jgi:hypothetical protein